MGLFLRAWQLRRQILIDDEWHALHKLFEAGYADIASHFGGADYCIPLTLYYRALFDAGLLSEWSMHLPPLLAGLALLAVGFWMMRDVADTATRTIWLGLVALSPVLVYLSRTARPYTLAALAAFVAIIMFMRWWRDGRHGNAIAYVVATAVAGWLHLMTLPFTLSPLLLFGSISLIDAFKRDEQGRARTRLFKLIAIGVFIVLLLGVLLLPALVKDWASLAHKAGGGAVTLESAWRSWLMLTGSGHHSIGIIAVVLTALGIGPLWRRDRLFSACLLFSITIGTAAIVLAQPAWIQHPAVLARYVEPVLAFILLFIACGIARVLAMLPWPTVRLFAATAVLATLFALGPIPETLYYPNQFFGHARFQFDYDPDHNPYRNPALVPVDKPVSAFYRSLSTQPPGTLKLIEAPWRLESNFVPHDFLQRVHRQLVKGGMVDGVCGSTRWGDFSAVSDRVHFREFVPLKSVLAGATWDADYLVIRPNPPAVGPMPDLVWPDMLGCLPTLTSTFGEPVFRDDEIIVYSLRKPTR